MKWSRSPAGRSELPPPRGYPRPPQDTYICCAYSPRCFIIQKVKPSNSVSEEKDSNPQLEELPEPGSEQHPSGASGHVSNIQSGGYPPQVSQRAPLSASDFSFIEPRDGNPPFEPSLEMEQQVVAADAASPPELLAVAANNAAGANPLPPEPVPFQEVYLNPPEQVDGKYSCEGELNFQGDAYSFGYFDNLDTDFIVANNYGSPELNNNVGEINCINENGNPDLLQASYLMAGSNVTTARYDGNSALSLPELKDHLRNQLEYYFSRVNLSKDDYLLSQMDADHYVSIATVAQFNLVKKLTDDINLVVEALRESKLVQVDEAGEKVRANPRSGVLILREIPESTPIQELEELFSGENCPKFSSCEFAHNSSWYVLFDSDEDTQKAYQYLREANKKFRDKPVMARIKAKAFTNAPFTTHKNGVSQPQEPDYAAQNINPPQNSIQFAYANVPNDGYNNQPICPPFYPPTMLQAWAPNTPPCVDLGTVLSVNGLSPQAAFRPLNNNSNRNNYAPRERPVKAYTPQNYNFSRSEQSRYLNRGQSTSYLQRQQQQLHQQAASFPNIVNNGFEYMGYPTSRSRNLHNFSTDMNTFFTAPNLYYGKVPALYPAIASQARHAPVMISGRQVGINAINCPDPSYVAVGNSNSMPYAKDSGAASGGGGGKQGADSQVKENWVPNQRQTRKKWWKENGNTGSSRNYSENSSSSYNKQINENEVKPESPKFDLETTSFPPLPGSMDTTEIIDVECYERCLSDIVKGVKPTTRDTKTQTSESALICSTKDSSTITIEDAVIPTDGAFTPPASPENLTEVTSETVGVESCQDRGDWEDFVDSPVESTVVCNASQNSAEAPFGGSSSPAFHPVSTNSMVNGSVAESAPATLPEAEPNVPNDVPERAVVKMPKTKPLDSLPKGSRSPCDLPSPKNSKVLDAPKNKYDRPVVSKHRTTFTSSKTSDSSSCSKERASEFASANTKTQDHCALKSSDTFITKDKTVQGHKNKVMDSHKSRCPEAEPAQLSLNGHADSESTVSSEDEKQQQPPLAVLTYSEVAKRAKDKMVMINQEQKEKDRQDAIVRQHKQQDTVAQSGPFKEFPRGRVSDPRPGSKEWRERRKPPPRAISLPAAGQ